MPWLVPGIDTGLESWVHHWASPVLGSQLRVRVEMSKYLYYKSDTYNFAHKSYISFNLRPEGIFTNRAWTGNCIERKSHAFHLESATPCLVASVEQSLPTSTQDPGRPSLEKSQALVLSWDHVSYANQSSKMCLYSSFFK